jgi:hypothetical protein
MNWIVKENPILAKLPFKTVTGNSIKYNVETALAGIAWIQAGDTITASSPQFTQRTANIYRAIGDIEVDKFEAALNAEQDIETALIEKKAKALSYEVTEQLLWGGTTTSSPTNAMKGLAKILAELESESTTDLDAVNNSQVIAASATSGALTLDKLDELIDAVRPGKPDMLIMSRRMRRKLNSLARASGTNLRVEQNNWGKFIELYDGIEIGIHDHLLDNIQDGVDSVLDISSYDKSTTRASGYDNSIIFAVKFGEADGFTGLHSGGGMVTENLGTMDNKDANLIRVKWYVGAACYSKYAIAALINCVDTAL